MVLTCIYFIAPRISRILIHVILMSLEVGVVGVVCAMEREEGFQIDYFSHEMVFCVFFSSAGHQ